MAARPCVPNRGNQAESHRTPSALVRGRRLRGRGVSLSLLLAMAGCAAGPDPGVLRIEGRLEAPTASIAQADWVVELRDDSADRVLSEQRGRAPAAQPGIAFVLAIERERIDATHRHTVRGALAVQGATRWASDAVPVDLARPSPIDVGTLRLAPYVSPGGFASAFDCGGRRITIGYLGDSLRLIDGEQVHDLTPPPGGRAFRYERPGDPATFVQLDDASATVSLQGRVLPRCTLVAPPP